MKQSGPLADCTAKGVMVPIFSRRRSTSEELGYVGHLAALYGAQFLRLAREDQGSFLRRARPLIVPQYPVAVGSLQTSDPENDFGYQDFTRLESKCQFSLRDFLTSISCGHAGRRYKSDASAFIP